MASIIPLEITHSVEPIALFGFARPRPGKEAELRQVLHSFIKPTRLEAGALAYEVHIIPDQEGVVAFYEKWANGQALADHLAQPQMQAFLERRGELLDGDLEIGFLTPLE